MNTTTNTTTTSITTTATTSAARPPAVPAQPGDFAVAHRAIRGALAAMVAVTAEFRREDIEQGRALLAYWQAFCTDLHLHHTVEDDIFYPAIAERVAGVKALLDSLTLDHQLLDERVHEADMAIRRAADGTWAAQDAAPVERLERMMAAHLDMEDHDLLPLFPQHFEQGEYDALTARVMSKLDKGTVKFVAPFLMSWSAPEERQAILGHAPLPMRVIYRLYRRSHARLARRALGRHASPHL